MEPRAFRLGPSYFAVFFSTCAYRRAHDQRIPAVHSSGECLAQADPSAGHETPRATAVAKVIPRDPLCWPPQVVKDHIPPHSTIAEGR